MSYSQQEIVAKRVFARGAGRAIPLARSFSMGADPDLTIGVCTIKIVTEEQVQAIAFGPIDQPPQILTRLDPLSRDVSDLTPFAQFMVTTGAAISAGANVRLWTAHEAGMETIDLLGRRYVNNSEAPQIVRDMGRVCRAFGAQLQYSGQPIIACALEQLLKHFVSGQSPAEDRHLASLVTWVNPPRGQDVFEATSAAALLPASGILPNIPGRMDDARVEVLRRVAKNTRDPAQRAAAHAEMHNLLAAAAQREWDLMVRARNSLLALPDTAPADADVVGEAQDRLTYHLGGGAFSVVQPHAVSLELKRREANDAATAQRAWRDDPMRRAAAVRRGRVLEGEILSIGAYTRGGPRPIMEIATRQPIVRLRQNDKITPLDQTFSMEAEVAGFGVGRHADERIVRVRIIAGFKYMSAFTIGAITAWEGAAVNLIIRETQMSQHIAQRAPWPLTGAPPHDAGSPIAAGDLVAAANALLRP